MEVKKRFYKYLTHLNIGQTAYELKSGLSRGQLSKKTGLSSDSLEKIVACSPELNMNWLLSGEGEMLKQGADAQNEPLKHNNAMKEENSTLKDLLYSFKEIAESVKINAIANERNAKANEMNAIANERNSRNIESLIEMIKEERQKGGQNLDQSGKENPAHVG